MNKSQWGTPSSERGCRYPACSPSKTLSKRLKILSTRVWEPRPGAHLWAANRQNEERREKATQNRELGSKQVSLPRSVSWGQNGLMPSCPTSHPVFFRIFQLTAPAPICKTGLIKHTSPESIGMTEQVYTNSTDRQRRAASSWGTRLCNNCSHLLRSHVPHQLHKAAGPLCGGGQPIATASGPAWGAARLLALPLHNPSSCQAETGAERLSSRPRGSDGTIQTRSPKTFNIKPCPFIHPVAAPRETVLPFTPVFLPPLRVREGSRGTPHYTPVLGSSPPQVQDP